MRCGDSSILPCQQNAFFLSLVLRINLDWHPTISTTSSSSLRPKLITTDLFEQIVSFTSRKAHSPLSCKSSGCSVWTKPSYHGSHRRKIKNEDCVCGVGHISEIIKSNFGNFFLTAYYTQSDHMIDDHLQSIYC